MSNAQPVEQPDIKLKIKEADTCHSMGMIQEALTLYEEVLSLSSGEDDAINGNIKNKINSLRKELELQEMAENQGLSAEEISLFRKSKVAVSPCLPMLAVLSPVLPEFATHQFPKRTNRRVGSFSVPSP